MYIFFYIVVDTIFFLFAGRDKSRRSREKSFTCRENGSATEKHPKACKCCRNVFQKISIQLPQSTEAPQKAQDLFFHLFQLEVSNFAPQRKTCIMNQGSDPPPQEMWARYGCCRNVFQKISIQLPQSVF